MIIFLIILLLIIIYNIKPTKEEKYLDKKQTENIKGIFIILVLFSHFNSYVKYDSSLDLEYLKIINWFGQAMVAPFLFYSGYGIMEQIKNNGKKYIKKIPKKRILTTLIKFDLAVIIYLILNIILNNRLKISQIILSLIGWESLGNSNWYIFVILILYLITYISFIITNKKKISLLITTILSFLYMIIFYKFNIKPVFWYDTVPCFILGLYYSHYKETISKYINYNKITYILSLIILMFSTLLFKHYSRILVFNIMFNISFILTIIIISIKISINSKTLSWCGKHLFEIYILQRIPMIIFSKITPQLSIYLYFILSLIGTILLTIIFKKLTDIILDNCKFLKEKN